MLKIFSTTGALALAILLSGPALKARFMLTDAAAYILPTLVFAMATIVLNLLNPLGIPKRVALSLFLLLPLIASTIGFLVGYADEGRMLIMIAVNCALGALVVLFPWNHKNFNVLVASLAAFGVVFSVHAILTFQTSLSELDAVATVNESRLSVAFAIGLGAIANLYFVVRSFSLIALASLGVCWVGMALSLSRGPVLFCAVASVVYLLFVFRLDKVQFGAAKKALVILAVASMIPTFMSQLMSVEKNERRFTRVFDIGQELADGGRGALWLESLDNISRSPVIGHGLGSSTADGATPHNLFLQYGEDSGLVGMGIMVIFFLIVAVRILQTVRMANPKSVNMALAAGAMFFYMLMNFQKSSDAYVNRESFVLSALPLAVFAYLSVGENVKAIVKKSRRRRKRLATAVAISEVQKSARARNEQLSST